MTVHLEYVVESLGGRLALNSKSSETAVTVPINAPESAAGEIERLIHGDLSRQDLDARQTVTFTLLDEGQLAVAQQLPWEGLLPTWRELPLGANARTPIIRGIRGVSELEQAMVEFPLRLLVVGCAPRSEELPRLDLEREFHFIRDALAPLERQWELNPVIQQIRTRQQLADLFAGARPQIFHFIGHAKENQLCLELPLEGLDLVDAEYLGNLAVSYGTRLMTLNACETTQLGFHLARRGCCVVANLTAVHDHLAAAFARAFYGAFSRLREVAPAVAEGRFAVRQALADRPPAQDSAGSWQSIVYMAPEVLPEPFLFPATMQATRSRIRIFSNVPGAEVLIDGVAVGLTPWESEVLRGVAMSVELRHRGYHPVHRQLTPWRPTETWQLDLDPETGRLEILIEPPVAGVDVRCSLRDVSESEKTIYQGQTDALGRFVRTGARVGTYAVEASLALPSATAQVTVDPEAGATQPLALHFDYAAFVRHFLAKGVRSVSRQARRPLVISLIGTLALLFSLVIMFFPANPEDYPGMIRIPAATDYPLGGELLPEEDGFSYPEELRDIGYAKNPARFIGAAPRDLALERPFYLDAYEVTVERYAAFLEAARTAPGRWQRSRHRRDELNTTVDDLVPPKWTEQKDHPDWPVTGVDFFDAYSYCRFHGQHLPTHREWEMAARGREHRRFPWGNTFDASRFNGHASEYERIAVGSFPTGATPSGIHDLAGNVQEWVADSDDPNAFEIGVVGGSYMSAGSLTIMPYVFTTLEPDARSSTTGFRCAAPREGEGMVEVEAGTYRIGGSDNLLFNIWRESSIESGHMMVYSIGASPRIASIGAFWIDKSEVSVEDYQQFLDYVETHPRRRSFLAHPAAAPTQSYRPDNWSSQGENLRLPVREVDWYSAFSYCKFREKRLPTVDEYEYLIGGPRRDRYPGGESWKFDSNVPRHNVREAALREPVAVDEEGFKGNWTLFHIVGNVSEWASDEGVEGSAGAVTKGGDFGDQGRLAALRYYRWPLKKSTRSVNVGFRCARSAE